MQLLLEIPHACPAPGLPGESKCRLQRRSGWQASAGDQVWPARPPGPTRDRPTRLQRQVSSSLQGPTTRLFDSIQSGEREGIASASPAADLCSSWQGQGEAYRDHECDRSPVPSDTSDPVLLGFLWLFLRALTLVPAPASFHR